MVARADCLSKQKRMVVAAFYTNCATSIVDDEDIGKLNSFIAISKGEKLALRFTTVPGWEIAKLTIDECCSNQRLK